MKKLLLFIIAISIASLLPAATVTWANNSPDADGFFVERSKDKGATWETIAHVTSSTPGVNSFWYGSDDKDPAIANFAWRVHAYKWQFSDYTNVTLMTDSKPVPNELQRFSIKDGKSVEIASLVVTRKGTALEMIAGTSTILPKVTRRGAQYAVTISYPANGLTQPIAPADQIGSTYSIKTWVAYTTTNVAIATTEILLTTAIQPTVSTRGTTFLILALP